MNAHSRIGYEYKEIAAKRSMISMIVDAYQTFGWELEETYETIENVVHFDKVILKFKRNTKIQNRAELTRLQRNFDACIDDINILEKSKYAKVEIVSYIIGILGVAFLAGAIVCGIADHSIVCTLLSILATSGIVIPYFLYSGFTKRKAKEIQPLIDQKYDEIYRVCKKAYGLLGNTDK